MSYIVKLQLLISTVKLHSISSFTYIKHTLNKCLNKQSSQIRNFQFTSFKYTIVISRLLWITISRKLSLSINLADVPHTSLKLGQKQFISVPRCLTTFTTLHIFPLHTLKVQTYITHNDCDI